MVQGKVVSDQAVSWYCLDRVVPVEISQVSRRFEVGNNGGLVTPSYLLTLLRELLRVLRGLTYIAWANQVRKTNKSGILTNVSNTRVRKHLTNRTLLSREILFWNCPINGQTLYSTSIVLVKAMLYLSRWYMWSLFCLQLVLMCCVCSRDCRSSPSHYVLSSFQLFLPGTEDKGLLCPKADNIRTGASELWSTFERQLQWTDSTQGWTEKMAESAVSFKQTKPNHPT